MKTAVSKIVEIYVLALTAVFPLFMLDKYYNIQSDKLYCMLILTWACLGLVILTVLIYSVIGSARKRRGKSRESVPEVKKRLSAVPLAFMAGFFVAVGLSTLCSEWKYEAFWGNVGRFQGFYTWSLYIAGFFMIAYFYEPRRWHIDLFIFIGLIIAVWGILDYLYLSPIGWQTTVENYQKLDFSSGIGNINMLTAVEGIYLLVSSTMFIFEENTGRSLFYFVTGVVTVSALTVAYSDNAIISIGTALCFLPLYAFRNKKGVVRYFALAAGYVFALFAVSLIVVDPSDSKDMRALRDGILYDICRYHQDKVILALAAALIVFVIVFAAMTKLMPGRRAGSGASSPGAAEGLSSPGAGPGAGFFRRLRIAWLILLAVMAAAGLMILYDANIAGHADRYGSLKNILVFDDDWGTHRGYNWRLALGYMSDFTPLRLLLGSGPETYSLYTLTMNYHDMIKQVHAVFDSPHNEWLQMLFTTGILGFITYYGTIASTVVSGLRVRAKETEHTAQALAFGILAYTLVSFVNVSSPNVTPILILCLGMTVAISRRSEDQVPAGD